MSTGALRLIDYDLVAAFSQIYQAQSACSDAVNRVVSAASSTTGLDPVSRAISVRQLSLDLGSLTFLEKLLVDLSDEHLPALRAAVAK